MTMRMADVGRSTFWMMGMALLQVLTVVQFEHAACGHRQRAAKGKKAMQKSELSLDISDENLESQYVSLLFGPMNEELEMRIGEFLLGKHASNASSSDRAANSAGGSSAHQAPKEAEAKLLGQLHLAELKTFLLSKKGKRLLVKHFREASDRKVLEARTKMRAMAGRGIFPQVEMQQPFLLRINLTDQSEVLANYEEMLSAPAAFFMYTASACRLHIPIIVERMLRAERKAFRRSSANVNAIEMRRAEVLKRIEVGVRIESGDKGEEAIPELAKVLYVQHLAFLHAVNISLLPDAVVGQLDADERHGIYEDQLAKVLALLREEPEEHRLQMFIRRTRGARARLYKFLDIEEKNIEELDKFLAWTEMEIVDRLMQEYILVLKANSAADERLKSQTMADILIQVHFLDKQLEGNENEADHNKGWLKIRHACLYLVDKFVDAENDYVMEYGTMCKHVLYKLRSQQPTTMRGNWDINGNEFFKAEQVIAHQWKMFGNADKKTAAPMEEATEQAEAEWLDREHATMMERLQEEENAMFKQEYNNDVGSTSQTLISSRTESVFNTRPEQTISVENRKDRELKTGTYQCPKDIGFFHIEPEAKSYVYAQYLFDMENQSEWKRKVELNALISAYEGNIREVLEIFPAKHANKLRKDWARKRQNLLENEKISTKVTGVDIDKGRAYYSVCKAHAFLLHRLIKADLGPGVDEKEKNKWKIKLRDAYVSGTLVELLAEDPRYGNFDAKCGPETAQDVVEKLIGEQMPMQWPNFIYLDGLLSKSEKFRHLICQEANRLPLKERMEKLMGEELFAKMELLYPDILQIEKMLPSTRMHIYGHYLDYLRDDPTKSEWNEMRIAIPLLVGQVRDMKTNASRDNDESKDSAEEALGEWLLQEILHDRKQLVTDRSICLLARFIDNSEGKTKGKQVAEVNEAAYQKERQLAQCAGSGERKNAMEWQREHLAIKHRHFVEENPIEAAKMLDIPGRKAAIQRQMPDLNLEFQWNANTYTDDNQLGAHFLTALFTSDKNLAARLTALFNVNFISWHRWMVSRLRMGKGPEIEVFAEIWAQSQDQMLARHEELFSMDEIILQSEKENWAKMQAALRDLLVLQKDKNWNSSKFADRFLGKDPQWNARWNFELWTEYNRWIRSQNRMELLELLHWGWDDNSKKKREFRQRLLKGFRNIPEARGRLVHLIGNDPKHFALVGEVLEIDLIAHDFPKAIDYMKAEHEIVSSSRQGKIRVENLSINPSTTSSIGIPELFTLD